MNTSLKKQFLSQDNKRILWELMTENNVFKGIPNNYVSNVKNDFETTLTYTFNTIQNNDDILSLNKQVIIKMITEVKKYISVPLTSEEILTKKQEKFQRGLETKQEEFNKLIQPPKPAVIDFSEKLDDEPIGSEMDSKLAETIAWREKQLSQVLEQQDPTRANDWIKNGKQDNNTTARGDSIKIGESIKIGDNTKIEDIINIKKVSFLESTEDSKQITQPTFMDKLKKKDIHEEVASIKNDMKTLLAQNKLILENHDKLINLLMQNK